MDFDHATCRVFRMFRRLVTPLDAPMAFGCGEELVVYEAGIGVRARWELGNAPRFDPERN